MGLGLGGLMRQGHIEADPHGTGAPDEPYPATIEEEEFQEAIAELGASAGGFGPMGELGPGNREIDLPPPPDLAGPSHADHRVAGHEAKDLAAPVTAG